MSVHMIDIGEKEVVYREASAKGRILLTPRTLKALREGKVEKGDVLTVSKITGLQAAKLTSQLLPLCHQIPLNNVSLELAVGRDSVEATSTVTANYRTGVEMEALVAVTTALLNVWDMVKRSEKDAAGQYSETRITDIQVTSKRKKSLKRGLPRAK
jgi:cyclic pyranopterin monophosphate synthase